MGTYYKIACDEVRESIDPGDINNLGVKLGSIAHPEHPFGPVAVFAMAWRWSGKACQIVPDGGDDDEAYYAYQDVTAEVVKDYNAHYEKALKAPLVYTGKPKT